MSLQPMHFQQTAPVLPRPADELNRILPNLGNQYPEERQLQKRPRGKRFRPLNDLHRARLKRLFLGVPNLL